jgi:hypothetical protein
LSVIEKVRRWIDGESAETVLEDAARDAQIKPRSEAESFIVKIAREIEAVIQKEILPLPQGTAIIPSEYIVFLSQEDDAEWKGIKRRGMQQGLYHILGERAREIAGKRKLETKSFVIELRVDATLQKGEIRVQHGWEDTSSGKTGVLPSVSKMGLESQNQPKPAIGRTTNPGFNINSAAKVEKIDVKSQIYSTPDEEDEVLTNVKPRKKELYRLEVWKGNVRQAVLPIYETRVSLGRGSKSQPVDIKLSGDPEISRKHATLLYHPESRTVSIINEGKNPALMFNKELPTGQEIPLRPGVNVVIGSYIIRVQ